MRDAESGILLGDTEMDILERIEEAHADIDALRPLQVLRDQRQILETGRSGQGEGLWVLSRKHSAPLFPSEEFRVNQKMLDEVNLRIRTLVILQQELIGALTFTITMYETEIDLFNTVGRTIKRQMPWHMRLSIEQITLVSESIQKTTRTRPNARDWMMVRDVISEVKITYGYPPALLVEAWYREQRDAQNGFQ